ncbi:glycosyltransferase family 2 protein [Halobacillus litoralis]|uniref:glycosyltransferase family 2 protein n=1 Tax=Halobacillus litoralis TaxID=45668 RepID=UPI001CD707ED|nr:glycosyltransferase [Halobacillus litoralis]MCA0971425.1 glycosyltransferase family 2 protein [Halobacillus litoralis]
MTILLYASAALFWFLLLFYSMVTVAGVKQRTNLKEDCHIERYPSVAVFIPAYNEALVIKDTLKAMQRLDYPGQLDIYLLDDQSSDDTGTIAQEFARIFSSIHYIPVPDGKPKGKSRVLNYGLRISDSEYFVVYDADNQPEPDAVKLLMEKALCTDKAVGAVGYVKTINYDKNILTRMIGLEFQVFQLLMQCGRWGLFKLGSLAGTNMLVKREVLDEVGMYDEHALAEDAELTVRITAAGYLLPVESEARTWEQEPESLKAFIKQRTRWLSGNLYIMDKSLHEFDHWKGRTFFLSMQHLLTYFVFITLLLLSDIFFISGALGYSLPKADIPLLLIWFMSYIVYVSHFFSSIVIDGNVTLRNVLLIFLMYFTYAQIFILLLARSIFVYTWGRIRDKQQSWEKTRRFKDQGEGG